MEYSVETCQALQRAFGRQQVARPLRITRYDPGQELTYDVTGVFPPARARVTLAVEAFVGGGFAGQVYRVRAAAVAGDEIPGLSVGGTYALKLLLPPTSRARRFRDLLYAVGFQGAFSLQVNADAVRAAALWQKLIRRAARVRFGDERAVVDVLATLHDSDLGSCGEISEWVDGRTWRFEADDHLDLRRKALAGREVDASRLGSPEYRAKRTFMAEFVRLLHEVGAPELARQYEWWTCKSQPNVLKRREAEADPGGGLTAVDFRAGLALLPLLPMSPGDVKLIVRGVARGSLVQFDRGDLRKLRAFVEAHREQFADLTAAVDDLAAADRAYRDSLPDVTHHHLRLLSPRRWGRILDAAAAGWGASNATDAAATAVLRRSRPAALGFALLGLLPAASRLAGLALLVAALVRWSIAPATAAWAAVLLLAVPPALRLLRRLLGRGDCRRHYRQALTDPGYFARALRARAIEALLGWHRGGRVSGPRAERLATRPGRFALHWLLQVLPARLHRLLTDWAFARRKLAYVFLRPLRLLFRPELREQWLREMLAEGEAKGMLTPAEAEHIRGRIKEPFIQKYLKSLAVHVCTLPVTQMVSVAVAIWYKVANDLPWSEAWDEMLLILVLFQVTPISPGSICRGLYVVYLVIRERNVRDYNVAVFLGFFKYVGYLAFPVQMAYRYPALARFMAGHWATEFVHVVPVFGERGALLEHGVFDLCYNRLLTLRRRFGESDAARAGRPPRYWHAVLCALLAAGAFCLTDGLYRLRTGHVPPFTRIWWLFPIVPPVAAAAAAALARGATVARRILLGTACGAAAGVLYGACHLAAGVLTGGFQAETVFKTVGNHVGAVLWPVFLFSLLSALGAFLLETRLEKHG